MRPHDKKHGAVKTLLRVFMLLCATASISRQANAQQLEKIEYGGSATLTPAFYLPVLAAQERGIFKKNGLDVDWVPFRSGADFQRALVSSAVTIGTSAAATDILSIANGLPLTIVGSVQARDEFSLWVSTNGKIKTLADLKNARIGVSRFGGLEHAYAQAIAAKLGFDKTMQYVSTGGVVESLAVLQTGGIDGVVLSPASMMNPYLEKRVTPLLEMKDSLPQPWANYTITARADFIQKEPATARKIVQSILEANRFIRSDEGKAWALEKMEETNGFPPEGAQLIYNEMDLSVDGKMPPGALENVAKFMMDHGLMQTSAMPPSDKLYNGVLVN